jgi:hypothetical protein
MRIEPVSFTVIHKSRNLSSKTNLDRRLKKVNVTVNKVP